LSHNNLNYLFPMPDCTTYRVRTFLVPTLDLFESFGSFCVCVPSAICHHRHNRRNGRWTRMRRMNPRIVSFLFTVLVSYNSHITAQAKVNPFPTPYRFTAMSLRKNMPHETTTTSVSASSKSSDSCDDDKHLKAATSSPYDNRYLWSSSTVFLATNALGYLITLISPKLHYHVDLLGTSAFAVAALVPLYTVPPAVSSPLPLRVYQSATAVSMWSIKLASFLFYRILHHGHDARLYDILQNPVDAAGFWSISALWGLVCSLPHALGMTSRNEGTPLATRIGLGMWAVGWGLETAADYQKWSWKQSHPHAFCNTGVWQLSQHPNWCGNILLWTGIFILNAPALIDKPVPAATTTNTSVRKNWLSTAARHLWPYRRLVAASLGPLFMYTLFQSQATGSLLGDAREQYLKRYNYGKDSAFTQYIDRK
jgi:steroid 5-alpha reductase family enzyme